MLFGNSWSPVSDYFLWPTVGRSVDGTTGDIDGRRGLRHGNADRRTGGRSHTARPEGALCGYGSSCSTAAAAGLVTGRGLHHPHRPKKELASRGGVVKNARVVDDGDLVAGPAGITSGLDLALHLIKRELSADVAVKVEEISNTKLVAPFWTR